MQSQQQRARIVAAFIAFLDDTPLSASAYERQLLNQFVAEELTLAQVLELLEAHAAPPTPRT